MKTLNAQGFIHQVTERSSTCTLRIGVMFWGRGRRRGVWGVCIRVDPSYRRDEAVSPSWGMMSWTATFVCYLYPFLMFAHPHPIRVWGLDTFLLYFQSRWGRNYHSGSDNRKQVWKIKRWENSFDVLNIPSKDMSVWFPLPVGLMHSRPGSWTEYMPLMWVPALETSLVFLLSLYKRRMKVWPRLLCWKLTNEQRAGSRIAVMKQTQITVALLQELICNTASTGFMISLCICRHEIFTNKVKHAFLFPSSEYRIHHLQPHNLINSFLEAIAVLQTNIMQMSILFSTITAKV